MRKIHLVAGLLGLLAFNAALQPSRAAEQSDEEVYAALSKMQGEKVDPKWWHLKRIPEFPGVILVSTFAYDRGDRPKGVFVDGKYGGVESSTGLALRKAGWDKGNEERKHLADEWVRQMLLGPAYPVNQAVADFGPSTRPYAEPSAAVAADGSVTVSFWVRYESGNSPAKLFALLRFRFNPQGEFLDRSEIDSFKVLR